MPFERKNANFHVDAHRAHPERFWAKSWLHLYRKKLYFNKIVLYEIQKTNT